MQRQKLIIFVKAPRPGFVKTRLAEAIGPAAACAAYQSLVDRVLARIAPLADVELRFSPDDAGNEINPWLKQGWTASPQGSGPLGHRLSRAFADAFADGRTQVVAIGSDCPEVSAGDVVEGWAALETQEVVLGPASDGGYWLIGLNANYPGIFEQIDWSTSLVLQQTLRWIKASGKSYHLLRELADVDTECDWTAYLRMCGRKEPRLSEAAE